MAQAQRERNIMEKPTIAEEHFARLIAFWHGQQPLYREPGGKLITVANSAGGRIGWAYEVDRYVDQHWQEYIAAAHAILTAQS